MADHLKTLADASLGLADAEDAIEAAAWQTAAGHLDGASAHLEELRAAWPAMNGAERALVARTATPLRERLEAARRLIPASTALATE